MMSRRSAPLFFAAFLLVSVLTVLGFGDAPQEAEAAASCSEQSCSWNLVWPTSTCSSCFSREWCNLAGGGCYEYQCDTVNWTCNDLSGSYCSGDTAVSYSHPASCGSSTYSCQYGSNQGSSTNCNAYDFSGSYCWDSDTIRSYSSDYSCSSGSCAYDHSYNLTDCPAGYDCSGAQCVQSCNPSWSCTDWSPSASNYVCGSTVNQTRTCTDVNSCGVTSGKPSESRQTTGTYTPEDTWYSSGSCTEEYQDYTCGPSGSSYAVTNTRNKADGISCGASQVCQAGACVAQCDSTSFASCSSADGFGSGGSIGNMCGAEQFYQVTVPSGQVCDALWSMTPDSGADYDLYARWSSNSCPATTSWDCRPYFSSDRNELCATTGLSGGTYKAMVRKYSGTGSYAVAGSVYNCKTATQLPTSSFFMTPANINQGGTFSVSGKLQTSSGAGIGSKTIALQCWNGVDWTQVASGTTNSTGNTSFSWPPASGWFGDISCRLSFAGDSTYLANTSGQKVVTVTEPTLTFPTGTWQRLWYSDPKTNGFSVASYLGEDTVGTIDKDWRGDPLYGGQRDKIGFKAGRTLTEFTPGSYTISVGADDGIKLFVNGGGNLLPSSAWDNNHSWSNNRHEVYVELSSTAQIEIHYRENTSDAKITFAQSLGVDPAGGPICSERTANWDPFVCGESPGPYFPPCDFYQDGNTCYYDSPATGCGINQCTYTTRSCTYNSICTVQAGQSCTSQGCVEETPPVVTINVTANQWFRFNPFLNIDFSDNSALSSIGYRVGSLGPWKTPTTNGVTAVSLFGSSYTSSWRIANSDWDAMPQGSNTLYVRAQDALGNCTGCNGSKSFTIKKDTVAPQVNVTSIRRTDTGEAPGVDEGGRQWLREGKYKVTLSVEDPGASVGTGSGVDSGYRLYTVRDAGEDEKFDAPYTGDNKVHNETRESDNTFYVSVGPPMNIFNDCVTQTDGKCRLEIFARDLAGNSILDLDSYSTPLNIDYTPPSGQ